MLKIKITLLFILMINISFAQKTAYYKDNEVVKAIPGLVQQLKIVDSIKENYSKQIKSSSERISKKLQTLLKPYNISKETSQEELKAILSENDKKSFEMIVEEQKLFEKEETLLEKEFNQIYRDKVGVISDRANVKIQNYCKLNKIDVLLKLENIQPAMSYFNENLDITKALIDVVKK